MLHMWASTFHSLYFISMSLLPPPLCYLKTIWPPEVFVVLLTAFTHWNVTESLLRWSIKVWKQSKTGQGVPQQTVSVCLSVHLLKNNAYTYVTFKIVYFIYLFWYVSGITELILQYHWEYTLHIKLVFVL